MSDLTVGGIIESSLSSFTDLRTSEVITLIGSIITSLITILFDTLFKLFIITAAKLLSAKILSHISKEKMIPDVFNDFSLGSSPSALINIEDANIHYNSQIDGKLPLFENAEVYYEDEPVYAYADKRGVTSNDQSLKWE